MDGVLKDLSKLLAKLPALGPRSARKIAITLALEKELTQQLIALLNTTHNTIKNCSVCNNLSQEEICYICRDHNRDHNQICIVSEITDLWAIERISQYNGVYHVLGGAISTTNEQLEDVDFEKLEIRVNSSDSIVECIVAMNATIQGQATIHYLQSILKQYKNATISTLALGIPMGAQLDYLDEGTIAMALNSRNEL